MLSIFGQIFNLNLICGLVLTPGLWPTLWLWPTQSLGNVSVFTLIFLNVWINDPGEVQEQKSSVQTHSTVTVTGDLHHRLSLISFIVFFSSPRFVEVVSWQERWGRPGFIFNTLRRLWFCLIIQTSRIIYISGFLTTGETFSLKSWRFYVPTTWVHKFFLIRRNSELCHFHPGAESTALSKTQPPNIWPLTPAPTSSLF